MSTTRPFRALVVDDDEFVRQATVRALRQEGFWCEVASDGIKAMEKLSQSTFDVAICDLRMPEMNGHSLAVVLLAMDARPAIIVLTGVLEPRLARDLLARGVDDVIAKPANFDFLVLKARALAERRRLLHPQEESFDIEPTHVVADAIARTTDEALNAVHSDLVPSSDPPSISTAVKADSVVTMGEAPAPTDNQNELGQPAQSSDTLEGIDLQYMRLDDIRPGMMLHQNVLSKDGRLLVSKGIELTVFLLDRIQQFKRTVGIVEPIAVTVPLDEPANSQPKQ